MEPLAVILETVARRLGASLSEHQGVFFIGDANKDDIVSAVVRMIPGEKQD
jgi:hypothetical protein